MISETLCRNERGSESHAAMRNSTVSKGYCVYIMTNKSRTLYIGVNTLMRRVYEHKLKNNFLFEGGCFLCPFFLEI
jgi:predicted GIY-YIG superfamily endonuclease